MKTSTLRHLVISLSDARQHHLKRALLESDPSCQSRERMCACQVQEVLDAIRFELAVRATHSRRTLDDAHRSDHNLKRLLAKCLELGDLDETSPSTDSTAMQGLPRRQPAAEKVQAAGGPAAIAVNTRSREVHG